MSREELLGICHWAAAKRIDGIVKGAFDNMHARDIEPNEQLKGRLEFYTLYSAINKLNYSEDLESFFYAVELFDHLFVHWYGESKAMGLKPSDWFQKRQKLLTMCVVCAMSELFPLEEIYDYDSVEQMNIPSSFTITLFKRKVLDILGKTVLEGETIEAAAGDYKKIVENSHEAIKDSLHMTTSNMKQKLFNLLTSTRLVDYRLDIFNFINELEKKSLPTVHITVHSTGLDDNIKREPEWSVEEANSTTGSVYASPAPASVPTPTPSTKEKEPKSASKKKEPKAAAAKEKQVKSAIKVKETKAATKENEPENSESDKSEKTSTQAKVKETPAVVIATGEPRALRPRRAAASNTAIVANVTKKYDAIDPLKDITSPIAKRSRTTDGEKDDDLEMPPPAKSSKTASKSSSSSSSSSKKPKGSMIDAKPGAQKVVFDSEPEGDNEAVEDDIEEDDEGIVTKLKVSADQVRDAIKKSKQKGGDVASPVPSGGRKRNRRDWSYDEVEALITGVDKYGLGNWKDILADDALGGRFDNRTNVDLKDKFRNLKLKGHV